MTRQHLLIVEDEDLNRELLTQLLEERFDLEVARDGLEALLRIESAPPDLILLDLSLPALDGWTLSRRLKADPARRAIPILAVTAHAMAGDREAALDAGCDAFLTKPIEEEALFATIARLLETAPESAPHPESRNQP